MKKILLIIGGIIVAIVIAGVVIGSGDQESSTTTETEKQEEQKSVRFEGRADAQDKDIELLVKESTELEGMKVTVTKVERKVRLGEFEEAESGKEFVIVTIALENVSNETVPYNEFDFRIQTASGQVLDGAFTIAEGNLDSGDLIAGGKHSGTVTFEVTKEEGHQYLIYKPNAFNSDRIIVQLQ
ncbi:DUF4352 domain-containing protein [Patescibacteria group bacterium]|nr:DUF4352 domain-containing protein [Patescibacteria group bacterium]